MTIPGLGEILTLIKKLVIKLDFSRHNSPNNKNVKKQTGDSSRQADLMINNDGIPVDVFERSMDTMAKLTQDALGIVREQDDKLKVLMDKEVSGWDESSIQKFRDPAIQLTMIDAGRANAEIKNEEMRRVLAKLIVKRVNPQSEDADNPLSDIIYSEAIRTTSKLTENQLKILALIFVLKHTKSGLIYHYTSLVQYLDHFVKPLIDFNIGKNDLGHLQYTNTATRSIGSWNAFSIIGSLYPNAFPVIISNKEVTDHKFTKKQINALFEQQVGKYEFNRLDAEVIQKITKQFNLTDAQVEFIESRSNSKIGDNEVKERLSSLGGVPERLKDIIENSEINHYSLTSIGVAIAITYWEAKVGHNVDHSIWLG